MSSPTGALLLYSIVVVGVTWAGALIPLTRRWHEQHIGLLTAFAGGVLLGAAFLHMIPEAAASAPSAAGIAALAGLLFVFFLERLIATHFCEHDHDGCTHFELMGYTFHVGLTLHSFIDGLVLGSGALIPELGAIVFIAIAAHKLPAVFSLTSILVAGGFRHRRVVAMVAILSLSTPAGAFAAFYGLRHFGPHVASVAVAVSAGTFLYVALSDLLPATQWQGRMWIRSAASLLLGLGLMWATGAFAHPHADHPADAAVSSAYVHTHDGH